MSNDLCEVKLDDRLRTSRQMKELARTLESLGLKQDVTIRANDYRADILMESGSNAVDYGILQAVADDLKDIGEDDMARSLLKAHEEAVRLKTDADKTMFARSSLESVATQLQKKSLYAFCDCVKTADAR